jgi:hypothetical protein
MLRSSYIVLTSLPLLLCGCQKSEFKEFSPPNQGFKVQMPGKPKERTENLGGTKLTMYVIEQRNGAYMVGGVDLPIGEGESEEMIQERLNGSRDGALKNVGGTLISEKKITLSGKYPGREFSAKIPNKNGEIRTKIFVVGRRLYQMVVVGTPSWANSADATKFLNSFELTK